MWGKSGLGDAAERTFRWPSEPSAEIRQASTRQSVPSKPDHTAIASPSASLAICGPLTPAGETVKGAENAALAEPGSNPINNAVTTVETNDASATTRVVRWLFSALLVIGTTRLCLSVPSAR